MAFLRGCISAQALFDWDFRASGLREKLHWQRRSFGQGSRELNSTRLLKVKLPVRVRTTVCNVQASHAGEHESSHILEVVKTPGSGRREIVTGIIVGASLFQFASPIDAFAADALSKYIKRKKLDPLETYVPTILLAQSQFQEVDERLEGDATKFADARSLLRNGPAGSFRTDIRAVAQYAAESGNDGGASAAVDQCLSALEDLDGLLFQAARSEAAPIEKMRQRLSIAVTAIDKLLATVPPAILEKGKAVAKAYRDLD